MNEALIYSSILVGTLGILVSILNFIKGKE